MCTYIQCICSLRTYVEQHHPHEANIVIKIRPLFYNFYMKEYTCAYSSFTRNEKIASSNAFIETTTILHTIRFIENYS